MQQKPCSGCDWSDFLVASITHSQKTSPVSTSSNLSSNCSWAQWFCGTNPSPSALWVEPFRMLFLFLSPSLLPKPTHLSIFHAPHNPLSSGLHDLKYLSLTFHFSWFTHLTNILPFFLALDLQDLSGTFLHPPSLVPHCLRCPYIQTAMVTRSEEVWHR